RQRAPRRARGAPSRERRLQRRTVRFQCGTPGDARELGTGGARALWPRGMSSSHGGSRRRATRRRRIFAPVSPWAIRVAGPSRPRALIIFDMIPALLFAATQASVGAPKIIRVRSTMSCPAAADIDAQLAPLLSGLSVPSAPDEAVVDALDGGGLNI